MCVEIVPRKTNAQSLNDLPEKLHTRHKNKYIQRHKLYNGIKAGINGPKANPMTNKLGIK